MRREEDGEVGALVRSVKLERGGLSVEAATGYYVWRCVNERTGKRIKRRTGTCRLEIALREVRKFQTELERDEAGLEDLSSWRKELRPLAEQYLESLEGELSPRMKKQKPAALYRALDDLGLKTAADLDHVARIHDRLLSLEKKGLSRATLRRYYQSELKQFSRYLSDHKRHLDRDPLATWGPLKLQKTRAVPVRRALLPEEVARAFLASDRLDELYGRTHRQRSLWTALLVTGARPGALASRDIEHLDPAAGRIVLGAAVGKKRRGLAALDANTLDELEAARGDRETGPLFLGPDGAKLDRRRLLERWRESFGLGLVDALWPSCETRDLEVAHLVNRTLLSGRTRVSKGGNPKRLRQETLAARSNLERRVATLADAIGPAWRKRMESVDLYCLKKSHRTWATVAGVPGIACDRQLGHASATVGEATEFARLLAGSETGRTYYVDMESSLVDASLSAKAVRKLLDEAFAALETGGVTMLLASRNALEPAKLRGPKFGPSGVPEGVVIVGPFSGSKARQALR